VNKKFNIIVSDAKIYEDNYSDDEYQNVFEISFITDISDEAIKNIIEYISSLSYFSHMMGKTVKLIKDCYADQDRISFELSNYISEFRY